jgi:predicted acyltransferase
VGVGIGLVWDLALPINKNLWTSSYVWFTAGGAALMLAACYWLIDVRGWKAWNWPFVVLGLNAITLFVASGLVAKLMGIIRVAGPNDTQVPLKAAIFNIAFVPLGDPYQASLLFALANLAVLWIALYGMYRRAWFLKA